MVGFKSNRTITFVIDSGVAQRVRLLKTFVGNYRVQLLILYIMMRRYKADLLAILTQ